MRHSEFQNSPEGVGAVVLMPFKRLQRQGLIIMSKMISIMKGPPILDTPSVPIPSVKTYSRQPPVLMSRTITCLRGFVCFWLFGSMDLMTAFLWASLDPARYELISCCCQPMKSTDVRSHSAKSSRTYQGQTR